MLHGAAQDQLIADLARRGRADRATTPRRCQRGSTPRYRERFYSSYCRDHRNMATKRADTLAPSRFFVMQQPMNSIDQMATSALNVRIHSEKRIFNRALAHRAAPSATLGRILVVARDEFLHVLEGQHRGVRF